MAFTRPLKMTPAIVLEAMGHPLWVIRYLRSGGMPMMNNWASYAPSGARAGQGRGHVRHAHADARHDVALAGAPARHVDRQAGSEGHLHQQDAVMAMNAGVDGIIVSIMGGRQLDSMPSPVEMLPAIRSAVGEHVELMLDSGVRARHGRGHGAMPRRARSDVRPSDAIWSRCWRTRRREEGH